MSAIEGSVTLEDVFAVVEAKRVPLAPELAGYLTLEIADGSDAGGGDVDPRTVFISEEGTVALVRPKSNPAVGDAETSVRTILAKLLDASGSATPALGVAAKRKTPSGMPALVEELEAALIPVNRAAGRRALARLAREVKRVTMGVGRNASTRVGGPAVAPGARPAIRTRPVFEGDEAATAKRAQLPDVPPPAPFEPAPSARPVPSLGFTPAPAPGAPAPTPGAPKASAPAPVLRPSAALPPPPAAAKPGVAPPPRRESSSAGVPIARPAVRARPAARGKADTPDKLLGDDEVESLLASFEVQAVGEKEMSRDLKAIAGLDPTPGPPNASILAELTKDVGRGLPKSLDGRPSDESVDELLSSTADASGPSPAVTPSPARVEDPVEALLAFADASERPSEHPVPTPRMQAAPMKQPAPPPPAPYASPYGPPPSPLAPPSPLVPHEAVGRPLAADVPEMSQEPVRNTTPAPPAAGPPSNRRDRSREPSSGRGVAAPPPTTAATRPRARSPREPRAPKTTLALLSMMLLALLVTAGAIYWKAPYVFTGGKSRRPVGSTPLPSASVAPPPAPACKVALALSEVPAGAEILLRVGQAPVDVERMPMKTRLEFVATAEGHQPRRAVVRADATWDDGPNGKPRVEVPIQLDPSKARPGTTDPWPAAEPGSEVGGKGAPGTVHVVSNVRGAEIWLLAGLGPEARIEQLRCDGDIDILIAGQPASTRKRLHVAEKDVQAATPDAQGVRVVTLSAKQAP